MLDSFGGPVLYKTACAKRMQRVRKVSNVDEQHIQTT